MKEGMPKILALLERLGVRATFFFTAEMAEKYPDTVEKVLEGNHELGMHGYHHERLDRMPVSDAKKVLRKMADIFSPYEVVSFRAPNLQLPGSLLPVLEDIGVKYDSSKAVYKGWWKGVTRMGGVIEIPVSATSFVIRWPAWARKIHYTLVPRPLVLFAHPWEFVDMGKAPVRWDCKAWTGEKALERLEETLKWLLRKEGEPKTIGEIGASLGGGTED